MTNNLMQLEYLFSSEEHKEKIIEYINSFETQPDISNKFPIKTYMNSVDETEKWTLLIEIKSDSYDAARDISTINERIIGFHPLVLINDSSAYFNRRLFPYVNIFERLLRKLLILKCSLFKEKFANNDLTKKSNNIIKKIEKMTLNELYINLFTDNSLVTKFREIVNNRTSSKAYYQQVLDEIPETVLWDTIIGHTGKDIKENFLKLMDYRNDIMHAHNINYADYNKQKNAFEAINKTLKNEIEKVINYPASAEIAETTVNAIYDQINTMDWNKTTTNPISINPLTKGERERIIQLLLNVYPDTELKEKEADNLSSSTLQNKENGDDINE